MEDVGVVEEDLPRAVAVVGVGVEDREPPEAVLLPQVDDAERDVVEAAISPEEIPAGVVPPAPMKAKALPISPPAIFSPAITTPPAECQAVEQSGSPFTPSISPGVWTFSTSSRETGPGS